MTLEIRQLDDASLADYKAIRLEGLQRSPEMFGWSYEEEAMQDDSFHSLRLQSGKVYGAYQDKKIVGMIGTIDFLQRKMRHRAAIWGVYVSPDNRQGGIGRQLIQAALDGMPRNIKCVMLGVGTNNSKAMALYKKMGFEEYGLEKMALVDGNKIYGEHLMVKFL